MSNKTTTILILAGVGGLIAWKYANIALTASDLNVSFNSIDLSAFPNAKVSLLIINVTNEPLTINALVADLSAQNTPIGTLSILTPVTIAPTAQTIIDLNFQASILGLPTGILNVIANATGNLTFNIEGNINVAGIPAAIPFNITQNFVSNS